MDETLPATQSNIERWSIVVAIFAAIFNILSSAVLNYQMHVEDLCIQHRAVVMNYPYRAPVTNYPEIISQLVALTPVLAVAIFRRYLPFTLTYALILFTILAGRIYYLIQFYRLGIDAIRKFDPPQLLWTIAAVISFAIVAIWVLTRLASFILKMVESRRRRPSH